MQTGDIVDNGKQYTLDAMGIWNGASAIEVKTAVQSTVAKADMTTTDTTMTNTSEIPTISDSSSSHNSGGSGGSSSHYSRHSSSDNSDSSSSNKNNSVSNDTNSSSSMPSKIEVTTGAGATVYPVKPKEESTKPVFKPTEEPTKPIVTPEKPKEEPTKPVLTPTESVVTPTKPTEESKPVITPTEPAVEPSKPTDTPTDPTSKGTTIGDGEDEIYINNEKNKPTDTSTELSDSAFYSKVCDRLNFLVNAHRGTNNKTTLSISSDYKISSKDKSQDMVDNNYFAHERDGKDFQTLNTELSGVKVFGENIAMNYFQDIKTEADANNIADTLFDQWKTSPSHNKNMLEDSWKSMGFGYAKGKEESGYTPVYATEHFGY